MMTLRGEAAILKRVYGSPYYVIFNIASAIAYYLFFNALFALSGRILFLAIPAYMIYALAGSASLLLTVSVYSVLSALHKAGGASTGALSALTTATGTLVATCNCQAPLLAVALYAIGFNTFAVSGVLAVVGTYETWFFTALILINLLFFYYTLHRAASRLASKQPRSFRIKMR